MSTRNWPRRLAGVAVLALATAAATTLMASPASAVIPNYHVETVTNPWNVVAYQGASAGCPSNTKVVGAGVWGGGAQVRISDLIVGDGFAYGYAHVDEDGYGSSWSLSVRVVCADLDGYLRVPATSANDSTSPKSASASCGSGRSLVGSGFSINGADGQVGLAKVVPAIDHVFVEAYEDDNGTNSTWSVTAYAICAYAPSGLHLITTATSPNSNTAQGTDLSCASNETQLSGGLNIVGGGPDVTIAELKPATSWQGHSLESAKAFEDFDGTSATWSTTVLAMCATT